MKIYSPAHQLTSSPAHQLTSSPAHQLTSSPAHQLTSSPAHQLTSSPAHQLTPLTAISRKSKSYGFLAALAVLSLTAISLTANAQTTGTWSGATNASWATGANWNGTPPDNTGTVDVLFDATSTANLSQTLDDAYSISGITNSSGTAITVLPGSGGTLVIGADGITLSSSGSSLTLGASGTSTGSPAFVSMGASQTWSVAGGSTLTFGGKSNQTLNLGGNTVTTSGSGAVTLNGQNLSNGTLIVGNSGTTLFQGVSSLNTGIAASATAQVNSGAVLETLGSTGVFTLKGTIALNGGEWLLVPQGGSSATSLTAGQITVSASGGTIYDNYSSSGGGILATLPSITGIGASGTATLNISAATNSYSDAMNVAGVVSDGTAGGVLALNIGSNGSGIVIMSGTNSYSGGTTLAAGTLVVTNNNSLGTGSLFIGVNSTNNNPTLAVTTGSSATVNISTLASGATQSYTFGRSGYTGSLTLTGTNIDGASGYSKTFTVNNTTTIASSLDGNSASSTYTVAGSGTLILTASSTLKQGWVVSVSSTLLANGASTGVGTMTVNSGGFLGGTGTIGGVTTVNGGGTIFAGNAIGVSAGNVLHVTGALTLASSGTYQLTLNSTTNVSDELVSTGAITLSGTLAVTDLDAGTPTSNLTIMQGTTLSGSFTGLAQGALVDGGLYTIDYTGNSVMLIAVPEPSTVALTIIFGAGMLLLFRRVRRQA